MPNDVFYKFSTTSKSAEKSESNAKMAVTGKSDVQKKQLKHEALVDENFEVGVLFASKPFVQAIANPFVGTISSK